MAFLMRVLRKCLWLGVVFLGITAVSFFVMHLAPGKPTDARLSLSPTVTPEARERLNTLYGLDKPLHVQYLSWLSRVARLDLGRSMSGDNRPVWDKIRERLPLTFFMNLAALVLTLAVAIPVGLYSAYRRGGAFDRTATVAVFIGFAVPGFWLALLLMLCFGVWFPVLPVSGLTSLNHANLSPLGKILDLARHLVLPVFIYVFASVAAMSRYMRAAMLEVLGQEYITAARARGLSTRVVLFKHGLRNALMPLITLLGLSVPGLIGGSVIIESVFSLPGLGQLFYQAVMGRDYPLVMGSLVLGALLTLAGNLLADAAYGLADPRIRTGGGRA